MWFLMKWECWVSWERVTAHGQMVNGRRKWLFVKKALLILDRVKSRWHRMWDLELVQDTGLG